MYIQTGPLKEMRLMRLKRKPCDVCGCVCRFSKPSAPDDPYAKEAYFGVAYSATLLCSLEKNFSICQLLYLHSLS